MNDEREDIPFDYLQAIADHALRWKNEAEAQERLMAVRQQVDRLISSFSHPPERIHFGLALGFSIWNSPRGFAEEVERNLRFFRKFFRHVVKWPGVGVGMHFEIYDFDVIRAKGPDVFDLIRKCADNGAIELMKGGMNHYSAMIAPLDDARRHIERWDIYVRDHFGIDPTGLLAWPAELQYHPYLPSLWKHCGISGIVLMPYHEELLAHNLEPWVLLGEDGTESRMIAAVNDDVKIPLGEAGIRTGLPIHCANVASFFYDMVRAGCTYAVEHGFSQPMYCIAHDLTNVEPKALDWLFSLIAEHPLVATGPLSQYLRTVAPRREVRLDQGNWDTFYRWDLSAEGWFTAQPWHLHINGLSFLAYRRLEEARTLAEMTGMDANLADVEEAVLLSERSISRAHWCHPEPRIWAQEQALKAIEGADRVSVKAAAALAEKAAPVPPDAQARFLLVYPWDREWDGMVRVRCRGEGAGEPMVVRDGDREVPIQWIGGGDEGLALFPANLEPRSWRVMGLVAQAAGLCPQAGRLCHRAPPIRPLQGRFSPCTAEIRGDRALLQGDRASIELDLSDGGRICCWTDPKTGAEFPVHGPWIDGRGTRDPEGDFRQARPLCDASGPVRAEVLATEGYVAGVRLTGAGDGPGRFEREMWVEAGSPALRVAVIAEFAEPIWFSPEPGEELAVAFEVGSEPAEVRWLVPGGLVSRQACTGKTASFDTFGLVTLASEKNALSLVSVLYPNGPRQARVENHRVAFVLSAARNAAPDRLSVASFGSSRSEVLVVPHSASSGQAHSARDEELSLAVHRRENWPVSVFPLPGGYPLQVESAEAEPRPWPEERF